MPSIVEEVENTQARTLTNTEHMMSITPWTPISLSYTKSERLDILGWKQRKSINL